MVNIVGSKDKYERWKPKGFEDYLTVAEVCALVNRDRSRLVQLERQGRLPKPVRVRVGRLYVRLYSPVEVRRIEEHFRNARPGNPKHAK